MLLSFAPSMMGLAGLVSSLMMPVALLLIFAIFFAAVFIPSLMIPGAKPEEVAKSIYAYLLQGFGILLMVTNGIIAVYGVLSQQEVSGNNYIALLLLFCLGGLTYLIHEEMALRIDAASQAVSGAIYRFVLKLTGYFLVLFSVMSVIYGFLFSSDVMPAEWMVVPVLLLFIGLLFLWGKRHSLQPARSFQSMPTTSAASKAAAKSVPVRPASRPVPANFRKKSSK